MMTVSEYAESRQISPQAVYKAIKGGKLTAEKVDGKLKIVETSEVETISLTETDLQPKVDHLKLEVKSLERENELLKKHNSFLEETLAKNVNIAKNLTELICFEKSTKKANPLSWFKQLLLPLRVKTLT